MGSQKVSGFGYNAEDYDAATGMLNLRARQYEPAINRFSQKDIVRGTYYAPLTLNRYLFTFNSPAIYLDPTGESVIQAVAVGAIAAVVGFAALVATTSDAVNKISTAYEYAKCAVEESDRNNQISLANEAYKYYTANYEELPQHVKNACDEAQNALQYIEKEYKKSPSKYEQAKNKILVGLCKIIYGDQHSSNTSYDSSKIGNSPGSHYSSVPLSFQSAVAEKMQDEAAQYPDKEGTSIKYYKNSNKWILDCWGSEAVNAYLWMDEDVYELYKFSSILGPVRRIYRELDERGLTYNIEQNNGKNVMEYWKEWLSDCENGKSVDVPSPGLKGFVEYGKKSQSGYDHIFEVLTPGTYNGVTYEHPIRTMGNTKDNYQIIELYDYVITVQRSGGYIAAWGKQPGTAVEEEEYVNDSIYLIDHYEATTTVGKLAVRGSYSKDSKQKNTLDKNTTVTVLKDGYIDANNEEWCQVRLKNGTVGYIMKKYLKQKK